MVARADASALPLVSIITPSLNQGRFIEAAIESVSAQDYPRIEHIVVDGASRDHTLEILARHSPCLRWTSESDAGQTQAINRGFRMTRGEIVSWLNADDLLLPKSVDTVVQAFLQDPHAMMVYGDGYVVDVAGRRLDRASVTEPFNLRRLIEVCDYILQPAAFIRREALEAVGYLDETFQLSMDWDLWIRIGRLFPVRYLPVPLAEVRVHADTKTSRAGLSKIFETRRIVGRHSRRRIPPVLLIYAADTLYRMCCRLVGRPPVRRGGLVHGWAHGLIGRVIETGQFPWERTPDPSLRRLPLPPRG